MFKKQKMHSLSTECTKSICRLRSRLYTFLKLHLYLSLQFGDYREFGHQRDRINSTQVTYFTKRGNLSTHKRHSVSLSALLINSNSDSCGKTQLSSCIDLL